jgi:hypothetical protein
MLKLMYETLRTNRIFAWPQRIPLHIKFLIIVAVHKFFDMPPSKEIQLLWSPLRMSWS